LVRSVASIIGVSRPAKLAFASYRVARLPEP
jgi:hypothetical protein